MRRWRLDLGMGGGGTGGLIGRPEPSDRKATITTTADNKYGNVFFVNCELYTILPWKSHDNMVNWTVSGL